MDRNCWWPEKKSFSCSEAQFMTILETTLFFSAQKIPEGGAARSIQERDRKKGVKEIVVVCYFGIRSESADP